MQEVLEQILDYLKGIWLKRRYLMVATWLICPLGWFAVSQLDDVYSSGFWWQFLYLPLFLGSFC